MTVEEVDIAVAEYEMFCERQIRKMQKGIEMVQQGLEQAAVMRANLRGVDRAETLSESEALPIRMLSAMVQAARTADEMP